MKTITLTENKSKFARLLIAANSMSLDRFLLFQEKECQHLGALTEQRIMQQMASELGLQTDFSFSKYKQFLTSIWTEAMRTKVVYDPHALVTDEPTHGMGY